MVEEDDLKFPQPLTITITQY